MTDLDKLRADLEAGRTMKSIAAELGVSDKAVRNAMRRARIVRSQYPTTAAHPELADPAWLRREYVDRGRSAADIARQLEVSSVPIRDALIRAGIEPRRRRSPRPTPAALRDRDWLEATYRERSAEAIGRDLGVSGEVVRDAMRRHGLTVDTRRSR